MPFRKAIFARVGYMHYYSGSQKGDEKPQHGGAYIPFSGKIFAKPLFLVGFWLFRNISSHRMMSERSLCNPRYPIIKGLDMI